MLQAGATQRYAAAQFGVRQSVVQRIWQRFLDTGSVEEGPKSGRPRKTSAVDDRYIVAMSRCQRFDTARTRNQQFLHATGITICEQTIRNRLHEGIERLDWPSRSPDLNPIEHAWDALQRRINARLAQPQTAQQLANAHLEEWVRIPP